MVNSSSSTQGATSMPTDTEPLQQARAEINDRINWQPGKNDEIPVHRTFADIDKALVFYRTEPHQRSQHCGVVSIGQQVQGVQAQQHPDRRSVRVGIPAAIQVAELEYAHSQERRGKNKADNQRPFDL